METKELTAAVKAAKAGKYIYTVIEKHPLSDYYMLYSPAAPRLYPFFGTLEQCKKIRRTWEARLASDFARLPEKEKGEVLNRLRAVPAA